MNENVRITSIIELNLDLLPIVNRMVKVHKWPIRIAILVCQQYKNYLYLRALYPNIDLPPSREKDKECHF